MGEAYRDGDDPTIAHGAAADASPAKLTGELRDVLGATPPQKNHPDSDDGAGQ
ncbi:MAG: hypothetical protein RBS40_13725 [Rhodocyclaceae bacterium]|jgi:hypothetical protein|nr:hypothetical protein [Rhodocyclaceae bacterium]